MSPMPGHRRVSVFPTSTSQVYIAGNLFVQGTTDDTELVDGRSDVWSLGAVLYFAVSSARPYEAANRHHGRRAHGA